MMMKKRVILWTLGASLTISLGAGDTIFPSEGDRGIDVRHYDLNITWDAATGSIRATDKMRIRSTDTLSRFSLDLHGLTVEGVAIGGKAVAFSRQADKLVIAPAKPIAKGSAFDLSVRYHGVPDPIKESVTGGWIKRGDGIIAVNEPISAKNWYPCNNLPIDKATYAFHITVPKGFDVVSNGKPLPPQNDGNTTTYTFVPQAPIATYSTMVHIGHFNEERFTTRSGIPVYNYYEKGVDAKAKAVFAEQEKILDYFASLFGPYPFASSGVVVMNEKSALAYETQTRSTFGVDTGEPKFAHELAHQWFGDSVTITDWKETWLKEGFATYAAALWMEHKDPGYMKRWVKSSFESMMGIARYPKRNLKELFGFFEIKERKMSKADLKALIDLGTHGKTDPKELRAALALVPEGGISNYRLDEALSKISFDHFELTFKQAQRFNEIVGGKKIPDSRSFETIVALLAKAPRSVSSLDEIYGGGTYTRGALALHALRMKMGDATFFKILRTYFQRYKDGNADSNDFIAVAESVGKKNLQPFFRAWLEDPILPDMPRYGLFVRDYR